MVSRCTNRNPGIGDPEESRRTDESLSPSFSFVLLRWITFLVFPFFSRFFKMPMFSKKSLFEGRYRQISKKNFSISNRGNFPATRHFPLGMISKPFSRDRNFSYRLPCPARVTDRRNYPDTQMVSNDYCHNFITRWPRWTVVSLFPVNLTAICNFASR